MSSRSQLSIVVPLVALVGLFHFLTIRPGHYWGDDFALYILHARNIVQGVPYSDTGYIFNPSFATLSPRAYPPVFPLLLAPVYAVFGLNLTAMKTLVIAAFLLSLITLSLHLREEIPFAWLVAFLLLLGLNPFFWEFKDQVMSDYPFLLFAYAALVCIERCHVRTADGSRWLLHGAATGGLIYLAYGTRSIGAVLAVCLVAYDLVRSRRISRFTAAALAVFILGAAVQAALLPDAGAYEGQVPTSLRFLPGNVAFYARTCSLLWDSGHGKTLRYAASCVAAMLMLLGYVARLRKRIGILEIFFIVYLVPICVWSGRIDRYLIPVLPLALFYTFTGLSTLLANRSAQLRRTLSASMIVLTALIYAGKYATEDFGPVRNGITDGETIDLFDYVRAHSDQKDVLVFFKPRALALYTGRRASIYPRAGGDEEIWSYFDRIQATHFISGGDDPAWWAEFLDRNASRLTLLHANARFRLYARLPPVAPPPTAAVDFSRAPGAAPGPLRAG